MLKVWIVASVLLLLAAGCFLEDYVRSDEGQAKLAEIEETALAAQKAAEMATAALAQEEAPEELPPLTKQPELLE